MIPPRLLPLLEQFGFARERLTARLTGPVMDSGDGSDTEVGPMTDAEYFWEPVADCWSVRERSAGPGPRATLLAGAGPWGRDAAAYPHPWPPPVTTGHHDRVAAQPPRRDDRPARRPRGGKPHADP